MQKIRSSIPAWAAAQASSALSAQALEQIYNVQANLIINNNGMWVDYNHSPALLLWCADVMYIISSRGRVVFRHWLPRVRIHRGSAGNYWLIRNRSDLGIDMWQLLPFTRGTVKITVRVSYFSLRTLCKLNTEIRYVKSANPFTKPKIQVNYFSVDFDLQVQIAGARLARRVLGSPPLKYAYCPFFLLVLSYCSFMRSS